MSKETKELRSERDALVAELEGIVEAAKAETRDFTPEESFKRGELTAKVTSVEDRFAAAKKESKRIKKEAAAARASQMYGFPGFMNASPVNYDGTVHVTSEPRTYQRGNGQSYLYDVATMAFPVGAVGGKWFAAAERLQRHAIENHVEALEIDAKQTRTDQEQYFLDQMIEAKNTRTDNRGRAYSYRALSTAAGAGGEFVPPLFDTQKWIEYMRAGRPLADCQNHQPLPDGTMTVNIPKVTRGTAVGPQSGGENTAVLEQDLQTEFISFPVVVKAGSQKLSLQLLERSPIAFDEITYKDLAKAYAQAVDVAVASGNGIYPPSPLGPGGPDVVGILNTAGVNVVTWTQGTPTLKGLYGQYGQAKSDIENTLFEAPTHLFMTPTYWEWIASQFDSVGRPVVVPTYNGPFNAVAIGDQITPQGALGHRLSGLDTFSDANLPQTLGTGSNQSVQIVGKFDENYLFESPVITRALPQTYGNQLAVLLQIYGYIAYTAARYPNANTVLTGTGFVSPVFNS
jgi:HK97 family phage major capsid protein